MSRKVPDIHVGDGSGGLRQSDRDWAYEVAHPRAAPTAARARRSVVVSSRDGVTVRVSEALPSSILQLLAKDMLTVAEVRGAERFLADYRLAYLSGPNMTTRYAEYTDGGGAGGVEAVRAAVRDARSRVETVRGRLTPGCYDVLTKMLVHDIAQVNVGGVASRYKDPKARRHAVFALLVEALQIILDMYS